MPKAILRIVILSWVAILLCAVGVEVQSAPVGAVASPKRAVIDAAKETVVAEGLDSKAFKCLKSLNTQALTKEPPGLAWTTLEYDLATYDLNITAHGPPPCPTKGSDTVPLSKSGATGPGVVNGPNNCEQGFVWWNTWNINGHSTSVWMQSNWGAFYCYSVQAPGSPRCWPGSSWPTFSVTIDQCYSAIQPSQSWLYSLNRVLFHVTETFLWIQTSQSYWYWQDDWIGGGVWNGCRIC